MASEYVKNLHEAAKVLRRDGYPVSADNVSEAAGRMKRMENYIVELHREVYPESVPAAGENDGN